MSSAQTTVFLDRSSPPHIGTLIAMASISALATNIYLPSLPSMGAEFQVSSAQMSWTISVFLLSSAFFQIVAGPISDALGRRPVLLGGLTVFLLATIAIPLTTNFWAVLGLRAVQAVVTVCMGLSRAIVRDTVDGEKAASRIAYVTMGMAIVPLVAPIVGGQLDGLLGWRTNFWFLAIVGVGLTVLIWADSGETAPKSSDNSLGKQLRDYPELLRSPRFWGYSLACALGSGSFFAFLGGAPFVGSDIYGLSPQTLGWFLGAPAIGYAVGNGLSGRYAVHYGINTMAIAGLTLAIGALLVELVIGLSGQASPYTFFGLVILVGLGNGLIIPNATAGYLAVRPKQAGAASGLGGAIMIGGGAALSFLAGLILGPETGETPLVLLMLTSLICGLIAMFIVIRRQRRIAGM
ncbi:multidrug effflux MFS transporter [Mesobacterium pallidum]|uniref:multidrug effflux MFS transporter n=1 Tax=Mesobacterium pallidum TaxID=2872037 RepID=UPI001EE2FBFC|nr:multidrug effflux MFS transporter [Mesobacterium pallidum]